MSEGPRGSGTAESPAGADPSRRVLMAGAGGAGLAVVLTACSSYGDPGAAGTTTATATDPSAAPEKSDSGDGGSPGGFAKVSDIPEGGGKVFEKEKIVVTQPSAGEFKAFSSTCTHKGCAVADVTDGTINCPCHGSKFKIADGSVAQGPASQPLPEKQLKVDGESISLA